MRKVLLPKPLELPAGSDDYVRAMHLVLCRFATSMPGEVGEKLEWDPNVTREYTRQFLRHQVPIGNLTFIADLAFDRHTLFPSIKELLETAEEAQRQIDAKAAQRATDARQASVAAQEPPPAPSEADKAEIQRIRTAMKQKLGITIEELNQRADRDEERRTGRHMTVVSGGQERKFGTNVVPEGAREIS